MLLAVLIAFVFVAGNYYGYRWLAQRQAALQTSYAGLKADRAEAEVDLQQSDLWAKRQEWVKAHEPALGDEGETKAAVLASVLKGARDHKLEIVEQSLNDSEHRWPGNAHQFSVKVKGRCRLCEWADRTPKTRPVLCHLALFSLRANGARSRWCARCKWPDTLKAAPDMNRSFLLLILAGSWALAAQPVPRTTHRRRARDSRLRVTSRSGKNRPSRWPPRKPPRIRPTTCWWASPRSMASRMPA